MLILFSATLAIMYGSANHWRLDVLILTFISSMFFLLGGYFSGVLDEQRRKHER